MKRSLAILVLCLPILLQMGCKADPRSKVTFKVDGINFILNTLDGITVATHLASHQVGSSVFDKTIVALRGRGQTRFAVMEFVIYHQQGNQLTNVYHIVNRQTDFDYYLTNNAQACHGWASTALIADIRTGTELRGGRDPIGLIQFIMKDNNVVAINFDGFFTTFSDDLIIGQFTSSVHIEATATIRVFN